jgi:hypothetical protein
MKKETMINKLREDHDIVLHPCLQWGSEDINTLLEREGVKTTDLTKEWKQDVIKNALEENAENICEYIFNCISDYMEMISDDDYREETF